MKVWTNEYICEYKRLHKKNVTKSGSFFHEASKVGEKVKDEL
jgi:hypothetical protein